MTVQPIPAPRFMIDTEPAMEEVHAAAHVMQRVAGLTGDEWIEIPGIVQGSVSSTMALENAEILLRSAANRLALQRQGALGWAVPGSG